MQQIIAFLLKNKSFFLFLLLLSISLILTIQSHNYHRSKFIHAANNVTGGVYERANNISEYFNLKTYNERLLEENAKLRKELSNYTIKETVNFPKTTPYELIPAKIIENSFSKKKNILVINRGSKQGVTPDMGVITMNGIVGIVDQVSNNYATVISILHLDSRINAKLKATNHMGSLFWNGENTNTVQLEDISKVAGTQINDTIVTGNYSVFPEGIPIGKVNKAILNQSKNYYEIDIALFNDMSNIGYVYVVKNNAIKELKALEQNNNE